MRPQHRLFVALTASMDYYLLAMLLAIHRNNEISDDEMSGLKAGD